MSNRSTFTQMASALPASRDPAAIRARIEMAERLLERAFVLPGVRQPVGLDFLLGLVPVIGDALTAALGAYIVWEARNLGMSRWKLARMAANVGIDTVIGAIPLAGDAFDLVWRSNSRNLRIIRDHLDRRFPGTAVLDGRM
jgi:hypothetical protein